MSVWEWRDGLRAEMRFCRRRIGELVSGMRVLRTLSLPRGAGRVFSRHSFRGKRAFAAQA